MTHIIVLDNLLFFVKEVDFSCRAKNKKDEKDHEKDILHGFFKLCGVTTLKKFYPKGIIGQANF